jgi:hypothetical protein
MTHDTDALSKKRFGETLLTRKFPILSIRLPIRIRPQAVALNLSTSVSEGTRCRPTGIWTANWLERAIFALQMP